MQVEPKVVRMIRKTHSVVLGLLLSVVALVAYSQEKAPAKPKTPPPTAAGAKPVETVAAATDSTEGFKSLDQDVQSLKKEVLDLNRELFVLEEELLFPANTQVAVFVSV